MNKLGERVNLLGYHNKSGIFLILFYENVVKISGIYYP
jgi:hypothetical protein